MQMSFIEFQRITSYLMYELVENDERDWDTKHEILCEELMNDFDIELTENEIDTSIYKGGYIGKCPECGNECISGVQDIECWCCGRLFKAYRIIE